MPIVVDDAFYMHTKCRAVEMVANELGLNLASGRFPELRNMLNGEEYKPGFLNISSWYTDLTNADKDFYVWDSRVILTYLVNKYAPTSSLYPKDPRKRAAVDKMLYFDFGTMAKTQYDYVRPMFYQCQPADSEKEEEYKKALQLFETLLSKTDYAAGYHITLADYSLVSTLSFMVEVVDYNFEPYPKISAWLAELKEEIPNYEKTNGVPLRKFKSYWNRRKYRFTQTF